MEIIIAIETDETVTNVEKLSQIKKILSKAEFEIFKLYLQGHSKNEIAEILYKSTGTIRTQNTSILKKLHCKTMVDAVQIVNNCPIPSLEKNAPKIKIKIDEQTVFYTPNLENINPSFQFIN